MEVASACVRSGLCSCCRRSWFLLNKKGWPKRDGNGVLVVLHPQLLELGTELVTLQGVKLSHKASVLPLGVVATATGKVDLA